MGHAFEPSAIEPVRASIAWVMAQYADHPVA
jgi:hypothetical protein